MTRFHTRPLVALVAAAFATTASASDFRFDFDLDGEPGTIHNRVMADPGQLVEAYLVIHDIPAPYEMVQGAMFGLHHTDGLELIAMNPSGGGLLMHDGHRGIAVAFDPTHRSYLPRFAARFVFRVLTDTPQKAEVVPSTGWGQTYDAVQLAVRRHAHSGAVSIDHPTAVETQVRALVNLYSGDDVPVEDVTWGRIKGLYEAR